VVANLLRSFEIWYFLPSGPAPALENKFELDVN
jgi:hypothetical protein